MFRILSQRVRSWLTGLCVCLSCFSNSLASVDICREPTAYSQLSIADYNHEKSSFERSLGETDQENIYFDLLFRLNDNWALGAGHHHSALNVDPLELQTNGYLHTFFLPLHRQSQSDRKGFRFSVAPALSASSNVMNDSSEYKSDVFQLLAALVWSRQLSERVNLRYGVCGDHRFGSYKAYPLVSVDWQPHADWTIELGFPTTLLTYRVSGGLAMSLRIAPDGNEWFVKDKALQNNSQVVYEARMLEWAFNWQVQKQITITASVGRQFHNRYEMTLLDDSRVRLRSDSVTRIGAALAWRF